MISIVLNDKYKLQNLNKGITLSEAIDTIAYTASIKLIETKELKEIGIKKGDKIKLIDIHAESKAPTVFFNGIVWEINKSRKSKELPLKCKERTVYIEESEDEYLLPAGQTATQRIEQYCKDWGIPMAWLVDTKINLSKAVYRKESIFSMMWKDIKETAQKGGELYKLRMLDKLNILKLGSNAVTWKLESIAEDVEETSSLEGMITQVKVLGKQEDDKKSPVIGIYKKDTEKYGTIQKLVQDEKITSSNQGQDKANSLFNTGEEYKKVTCAKDINTIRAGDRVQLDGVFYYVTDITHNLEKSEGMSMTLGEWNYVKRKFYGDV